MHQHQWIIFLPNFILSIFYVTLYFLSYCVFHFNWCRVYVCVYVFICMYMRIYLCVYVYIHVYICLYACECMLLCIHDYMYVFYVCSFYVCWFYYVFFTYGCLVRDDLIKKFKQTLSLLQRKTDYNAVCFTWMMFVAPCFNTCRCVRVEFTWINGFVWLF